MYVLLLNSVCVCVCVDNLAITTTVVSLNIILAVKAHHYCVVFAHKCPHTHPGLILVIYSTSGCVLWLHTYPNQDSIMSIYNHVHNMHQDSVMSIIIYIAMYIYNNYARMPSGFGDEYILL